jgi:broad specificity phosphatase PhoE
MARGQPRRRSLSQTGTVPVVTQILLVRHGQSEWNALGRWQGQADPALSDVGRQQAFTAARRLGSVDVIVSSDLQRASETAQIISGQLGVGPVVIDPRLRERDVGEWSGLTHEQIEDQWPGYLDERRYPPGWEYNDVVLPRLYAVLDEIAETYEGGEVVVIAHGGLVYALEEEHGFERHRLPNLGARWISHHGDRLSLGERILLVDKEDITTVPAQI